MTAASSSAFASIKRILAGALLAGSVAGATAFASDGNSLFDDGKYQPLVAERKALQVGDVLTVIVQESATASSSTDLRASRKFSVAARAGTGAVDPHSATAGTGTDNTGSGSTQRTGRLLAQVSVRVIDVRDNGTLEVAGQQSLTINGEEQHITLNGLVRPRDISTDNTVLSSRVAEARIRFDGKGFLAQQSRAGWLGRFFGFLGF